MAKEKFPKILICLVDPARGKTTGKYLSSFGYHTKVCQRGGEAKEIISTWEPNLIICDLLFPHLGAFAMLKWLKSYDYDQRTSMIVISDHNSKANVEAAFALGAHDYMTKPLEMEDLLGRVVFHSRKHKIIPEKQKIPQAGALKVGENEPLTPGSKRGEDERMRSHRYIELLLEQAQSPESVETRLHHLLKMANVKYKGVRINLVKYEDQVTGFVVANLG